MPARPSAGEAGGLPGGPTPGVGTRRQGRTGGRTRSVEKTRVKSGFVFPIPRGTLRIIAAMMQGGVIRTILRHLKLAVDPPPIVPARVRQEAFAWSSA